MTTAWLQTIDTCPSTNRIALDRASELTHGDAIFTRQQTAGRGQRNRVWQSPKGVITVSFVMHDLSSEQLMLLSFSAGLAIIDTIEILIPTLINCPKLKWTNDILIHDRKVAGILCEIRSSLPNTAVIGIGLNLAATFEITTFQTTTVERTTNPISLHEVATTVPDDLTMLDCLRQCLLDRIADSNQHRILQQIRLRDALYGRSIEFELPNGQQIAGTSRGIGDRGALLIETPDRIVNSYYSGRVLTWT